MDERKNIDREWIDNSFATYRYKGIFLNTRRIGPTLYKVNGQRDIVFNNKNTTLKINQKGDSFLNAMEKAEKEYIEKMKSYGININ